MKRRTVTKNAERDIQDNWERIASDNIEAADRYYRTAYDVFFDLADNVLPRRAHERLPEHVRAVSVKGFKGYILHIAIFDDSIYLIGAYMPGLSDRSIIRRSHKSLREI